MTLETFADLIPQSLLGESGSVFYSGRRAYSRQSDLYVLGLNPGGNPETQADETISWHTGEVLRSKPYQWSAYRDEAWRGQQPGEMPFQRRVLHMFRQLNLDPGEVPSSNVVFQRSRDEYALKDDFARLALLCWPFHQAVIETLEVRVVVCFGYRGGSWVSERLGARVEVACFTERHKKRPVTSRVYESRQGRCVVVLSHPSRFNWCARNYDPTRLVGWALSS